MVYDTIYAHQDKVDDAIVGIKSTALKFGERTKPILSAVAACQVSMLALAGYMNSATPFFYACSVGAGAAHLTWLIYDVNINSVASCAKWFKRSIMTGAIIWSGMALDYASLLINYTI